MASIALMPVTFAGVPPFLLTTSLYAELKSHSEASPIVLCNNSDQDFVGADLLEGAVRNGISKHEQECPRGGSAPNSDWV